MADKRKERFTTSDYPRQGGEVGHEEKGGDMELINFFTQFFGLVTLAGIIILSRFANKTAQIVIGVTLIILGLLLGSGGVR